MTTPTTSRFDPHISTDTRPYTVVAIDPGPDFIGMTGAAYRIGKVYGSLHSADMRNVWTLCGDESGGCPDVIILEMFETGGRVDKFMIGTIQSVGGWIAMAHKCGAQLFLHYPTNRYGCLDMARQTVRSIYTRDGRKWSADARHEVDAVAHLHAWELVTKQPGKFGMIYEPDPKIEWAYHLKKVN